MLINQQNSKEQITSRSIDIKNSSNGSLEDSLIPQQINEAHLHSFITHLPQQVRKSFRHAYIPKYVDGDMIDIGKGTKPYLQSKDNKQQQEIALIENYLGSHNKFKTYFKSQKYKKIYQQLAKKMPLEKSYYCLYMQDKLFSLNKHIKVSLVHKQTSFIEYLNPYFQEGKILIEDFYRYFLVDDQLYKGSKKVNIEAITSGSNGKSSNSNQFLYALITFLYQMSIFYRSKNQRKQAKIYYESNLKIVYKILESSTSSSRLRRKISQYLISFSSFLIQNRQLIKAQKILQLALKNSINLVGIIETKLKYSYQSRTRVSTSEHLLQKFQKRTNRKLKQAFQLMIAIYLNSAVVFQLQCKQHLSYLAINQVKYIEQILYKNYSIKSKISEVIKKPKQSFDFHNEKIHLLKCYFDVEKIIKNLKQEDDMRYNENVGIYGLKREEKYNKTKNKNLIELFCFDSIKNKTKLRKQRTSIFASKIALIQYDNKKQPNDNIIPGLQYTINTKSAHGSQSTTIYNQNTNTKQRKTLTNKLLSQGVRKNGRKLSKFYNQAITQNQINQKESVNKINLNSNKQFKKSQKKVTYPNLKSEKMDSLTEKTSQSIQNKTQKQKDDINFLDQLIDSEISIKRFFLYGKDSLQKYDLLSKGKTLYKKKEKSNQNIQNSQSSFQKIKKIMYQTKNQMEILYPKGNQKFNTNNTFDKSPVINKNSTYSQPFKLIQNYKSSINVVKSQNQNLMTQFNLYNTNVTKFQKKRSSKSLKSQHMSYKQAMEKMEKSQKQFLKKDYIEKHSIYRLKCKSQNIKQSKNDIYQLMGDFLGKSSNKQDFTNTMKKQNDQQAIVFKLEGSQKASHLLKQQIKGAGLTKKTLNSNLFSSNQTGIRLLKKIIFKHKKTLKITKPDLFVNYNKIQSKEQQIRLVERQSLLMVQYHMCQQETKARIKQNMHQLIMDNLRNSQENQKRVQKLNKAISEYDKSKRLNEFNTRMREEYDTKTKVLDKFLMSPNPQYFANTFKKDLKDQKKDSNFFQTDQILKNIFQSRIILCKTDKCPIGLESDKFLTGNKINNPNLFLSSIQYKQQDKSCKKLKTLKNLNRITQQLKNDHNDIQNQNHESNVQNKSGQNNFFMNFFNSNQDKNKTINNNWM